MADPVKLRGHHLLCMLTYVGYGYTPAFVENYNAVIARINAGAAVTLVQGMDDVCAALHCADNGDYTDAGHCLEKGTAERDRKALRDIGAALQQPLQNGDTLTLTQPMIADLRQRFAAGSIRQACAGCEWHNLCTDIAAKNYTAAKLFPPDC
jgi:uncharacterized protein